MGLYKPLLKNPFIYEVNKKNIKLICVIYYFMIPCDFIIDKLQTPFNDRYKKCKLHKDAITKPTRYDYNKIILIPDYCYKQATNN